MREQIPCLRILPDNNHVAIQQRCGYMPANFQRIAVRFVEVGCVCCLIRQIAVASRQRNRPPEGLLNQRLGAGHQALRTAMGRSPRSHCKFHGSRDRAVSDEIRWGAGRLPKWR